MTREERIEIKKSIEEKIKQLKEDIKILKEHMKPVTLSCVVDKANKMDAISNNAIKEAVYTGKLPLTIQYFSPKIIIQSCPIPFTRFGQFWSSLFFYQHKCHLGHQPIIQS